MTAVDGGAARPVNGVRGAPSRCDGDASRPAPVSTSTLSSDRRYAKGADELAQLASIGLEQDQCARVEVIAGIRIMGGQRLAEGADERIVDAGGVADCRSSAILRACSASSRT